MLPYQPFLNLQINVRKFADLIGSITIAKKGSRFLWKISVVLTSIPDNQQPKLGCEWYHPIMLWVLILSIHCEYAKVINKNYTSN
jgi:hypothetical protein